MRWIGSLVLAMIVFVTARGQDNPLDKEAVIWLKHLKESKEVKKQLASLIKLEIIGTRAGVVEGITETATGMADEEVRREAVLVLGRMGPAAKAAIPVLGEILSKDKADRVREAAAMALGGRLAELAKSQVLVLGRALKDSHGPTRTAAAETLKNMRADAMEALPNMIELIKDAKGEDLARRYAILAATRLPKLQPAQNEEIVASLNMVAKDEAAPGDVREAALDGLGHLKLEKGIPGLVAGLQAKDAPLRRTAIRGLVPLKEKAAEAWTVVQKVTRDPDTAVRAQAILVCGNIGKVQPEAVKELIHAAEKDISLENRLSAIRAIGDLGKVAAEASELLQRLAASDVRASIRDAASDALRKIK